MSTQSPHGDPGTLSAILHGEAGPTAGRAARRTRIHLRRVLAALRGAGPGRHPGSVVELEETTFGLVVRGWAAIPGQAAQAVAVTVDGAPRAWAWVGGPTPHTRDGRPRTRWTRWAGWEAQIPWTDLPTGPHGIGAIALWQDGIADRLDGVGFVSSGRMLLGAVDMPQPGETIHGRVLLVEGWLRGTLGFDHLEVRLADRVLGRAQLMSRARPDVAAFLPDADAPLAGWSLAVARPDDLVGAVDLVVEAIGAGRRQVIDRRSIVLGDLGPAGTPEPDRLGVLSARTAIAAGQHSPRPEGLHLLVATHQLGLGGAQLYLHELLRPVLEATDVSCTILTMADGVLRRDLETLGARVHVLGRPPLAALAYEEYLHHLVTLVRDTGANALLANTADTYWAMDLADRLGIPAVWVVHESFHPDLFLHYAADGCEAEVRDHFHGAFGSAAAVVFVADATKALFEHLARPGRCLRLKYGPDIGRLQAFRESNDRAAVRETLGIAPSDVLFVCVGTVEPRKAQGILSMALGRIHDEHPEAVLAMVGDQGGYYSEGLAGVLERLDLGDRIRVVPLTPDVEQWYFAADAFILGSDIESLPRSTLEAMAFGLPVLNSAVWGVPELVTDGVTGLLFEPSSLGSPADAMRRFLAMSPEQRQELGDAGRRLVEVDRSTAYYPGKFRALLSALVADPTVLPDDVLGER